MHHAKTIASILAQSCVTPLSEYMPGGVTHDCASILDSIAKELLVSTISCMVHPYIAIHSLLHLLHIFGFA